MSQKVHHSLYSGKPNLKAPTATVEAIGKLYFEGNVIPHGWLQSPLLCKPTGKPHLLAILILADILYWYRPSQIRDEESGQVLRTERKFSADKLQKSYQSYADLLGYSKRQVTEAFDFLEKRGLIQREFRTITYADGRRANNVLYVEPNAEKVRDSLQAIDPITKIRERVSRKTVIPSYEKSGEAPPEKRETNTHTTTNNNETENNPERVCVANAPPANADTHAALSPLPSAKKKTSKKPVKAEEERIQVTYEQQAVFDILKTYFPGLGTASNRRELAYFVKEVSFSPYGAMLMCSWLESNARHFPFMKITLLRQIREEFNAAGEDSEKWARYYIDNPISKKIMKLRAIHDEWYEKHGKKE